MAWAGNGCFLSSNKPPSTQEFRKDQDHHGNRSMPRPWLGEFELHDLTPQSPSRKVFDGTPKHPKSGGGKVLRNSPNPFSVIASYIRVKEARQILLGGVLMACWDNAMEGGRKME